MPKLNETKILIMATDGFEKSELTEPRDKLREVGVTVHVASPEGEDIRSWDENDWGEKASVDLKIQDVDFNDYDGLVLPGGQINPDILRTRDDAVQLIRDFVAGNKIVAAICHAPWLLIEAGVAEGRKMTSFHSIRTDLKNAGAHVVDENVAISNGIITSRNPDDLPAFIDKIMEELREGEHPRDSLSAA